MHPEAPAADFWLMPQSVQLVWPSARKVPAGQSVHCDEFGGETDPRGQSLYKETSMQHVTRGESPSAGGALLRGVTYVQHPVFLTAYRIYPHLVLSHIYAVYPLMCM